MKTLEQFKQEHAEANFYSDWNYYVRGQRLSEKYSEAMIKSAYRHYIKEQLTEVRQLIYSDI